MKLSVEEASRRIDSVCRNCEYGVKDFDDPCYGCLLEPGKECPYTKEIETLLNS